MSKSENEPVRWSFNIFEGCEAPFGLKFVRVKGLEEGNNWCKARFFVLLGRVVINL